MRTQTFTLSGPQDATHVMRRAGWIGYPCTVTLREGVGRSISQNSIAHQWAADVAAQLGDRTPEDVRAHFKLHHGVPIRREEDNYAAAYDEIIRPLPYAAKLAMMRAPLDFPVTRGMSIRQMSRYLDSISQEFAAMGVRLTDPDERRFGGSRQ